MREHEFRRKKVQQSNREKKKKFKTKLNEEKEMSKKDGKREKIKLTRSITQSALIYLEFFNRIFHLRTASAIISFVNC